MLRIKASGGVIPFLDRFLSFLRPRYDEYSKCIDKVKEYYDVSNGRGTLAELSLRIGDCVPRGRPDTIYIIGWVVAAVVVGVILLLEGEAGGDDGDDGELGDFPEPDPDADTPA